MLSVMTCFKNQVDSLFLFPALIIEFFMISKFEEYSRDIWVYPKTSIYPLKIQGEGALGKSKKIKINSDMSVDKDTVSCNPSIVGLSELILVEMRAIKELVSWFNIGLGESSTTHHLYVAQTNYERYLAYQKE